MNPPLDPNAQAQIAAWQAEQQRQRDIALKQLQGETDIHTHAQKDINQQGYENQQAINAANADSAMKALKAQFEGQGGLQTQALTEQQKRQQEAEGAQFGLQGSAQEYGRQQQNSQQAAAANMLRMQAQFQKEAEERRNAALNGLLNNFNSNYGGSINTAIGGGGGGGTPGPGGTPGAGVGGEDAARAAAFAQAKDQAGQIGRSSMTALQNQAGARGLTGSGLAVNQAGGVIGEGARQLGEVNREQLTNTTDNARKRASEQYQGAITMRGQNIGAIGSLANLYGGARAY